MALSFLSAADAQPQIDEKAPGFIASTLDGKRVTLKYYLEHKKNKAVVLSFFATWYQPCKGNLKYLQKGQDWHFAPGLQVLCVLTQDSAQADAAKDFMQKHGVGLPVLTDEFGIVGKRYAITALPANFVIDKEGILRARYFGYSGAVRRDYEGKLKGLLARP